MTGRAKHFAVVCALFSLTVAFLVNDAKAEKQNPAEIVKRVRKTLDRLKTFTCSFETEQFWKELDRTQRITGKIYMEMEGDTFRLRLERPEHLMVIDGKTVWTYLPRHNQVQISDYVRDEEQFPSPHNLFNRYADERTATVIGEEEINGSPCDIVSLVPEGEGGFRVTVWIDRMIDFPVKAVEETSHGDTVTHLLSAVRLNAKLDDDLFTFVPPKDAVVVDMRE